MHMPALEELRLHVSVVSLADDCDDGEAAVAAAELELAWLAQLPALKKVAIGDTNNRGLDYAVWQTVCGLLASKPWVQVE
jgi:hypothetical protein